MTAIAPTASASPSTRRQRAAAVAAASLRGGTLAAIVAVAAWLLATTLSGTVFIVLIVLTAIVAAVTVMGRDVSTTVWLALAAAWALVMLQRWAVNDHGGVWVGIAAWVGVVLAARRAGIPKWALPLLAYPALSAAIVLLAGEDLLSPWGISWLWIAAVLGPVLGVRVLLDPSPRDHQR